MVRTIEHTIIHYYKLDADNKPTDVQSAGIDQPSYLYVPTPFSLCLYMHIRGSNAGAQVRSSPVDVNSPLM